MSLALTHSPDYLHSATAREIMAVVSLPPELAQAWCAELAVTHDVLVAYGLNTKAQEGIDLNTVPRIAKELHVELTDASVPGQLHMLAPAKYGSIALWRQRPGTIAPRAGSGHARFFKADALC